MGAPHQKEIEAVPLKVFMTCPKCSKGYTGYIVKKKNLWYYKCRTIGCCASKNAAKVNKQFVEPLSKFEIKEPYLDLLLEEITSSFESLNEANRNQEKAIKVNGNEIQKKIDTVEEKYFVTGEMSKETYGKFIAKLTKEKQEILASLQNTSVSSSNVEEHLETVSSFSLKLATAMDFQPGEGERKAAKSCLS